ncbi:MAG TPA: HAD-IIA family hydrolase [Acidimicrobiales bacterium]
MAEGVLLDIDGVLTVSWDPLPGAVEAIQWLQAEGIGFRLLTNTSSRSRRDIADRLAASGMPVGVDHILTAVTSAAGYLASHYAGVGCLVVNEGELGEDLAGVEAVDARSAGVVLLCGAGPTIGYAELDAVFKLAMAGAPVVALHRNTRYQTAAGPALDMGAFIVGIEAAAGIDVMAVGKPEPAMFESALADLGIDARTAVMIGDDIVSDVLGAQALGITGVLVRTGKFRPSDLDGLVGDAPQPDHVIADIAELPALLGRLAS